MEEHEGQLPRTVILGGGIAGIETLLALHDLAGDLTEITLVAPSPDFLYKPTTVEEPFTTQPAERRELAPLAAELGATFHLGAVHRVDPHDRRVELGDGDEIAYDRLVICVGGKPEDAYRGAITFRATGEPLEVDALLDRALEHSSHRLAFVVPPGVSWSLPLYELALMTRRRANESDRGGVEIGLYTPEAAPLVIFGGTASDAVAELLRVRGIEFVGDSDVIEDPDGGFTVAPGHRPLEAGGVVALPLIEGPRLAGVPADDGGFIPIDKYTRVAGLPDVYAAGDGTAFAVKQGGIGTQQADTAAEHIAASLGAEIEPAPFRPVLRGQLITAGESLNIRHDLEGERGEGDVSLDYLWWPPHKVSGRYLAPWLENETPHRDPEPPLLPLDVEVSLPHEWHAQPMAIDPDGSPDVG